MNIEKESSQTVLQALLGKYAEEYVHVFKTRESEVKPYNSQRFAAELLTHVRQRFVDDTSRHKLGFPDPSVLKLEDMKWVFHEKVKPNLGKLAHELFLCNGCENATKRYSFEGVISHFASKHTDRFSFGKTVVSWQNARWPKDPPFKVQSRQTNENQAFSQRLGKKGSSSFQSQRPFSVPPAPPQGYLVSPGPNAHLARTPGASVRPGPAPPETSHGVCLPGHNLQASYPVSPAYTAQSALSVPISHSYVFPPRPTMTGSHAPQASLHGACISTPVSSRSAWSLPQFPSSDPTFAPPPNQPNPSSFHHSQLDEVAHIAYGVWASLSHVKAIAPSVRMYVIIHHAVSQFQTRFSNEPNLDLFIECVKIHTLMRPLKDVNGLACKTCVVNDESHEGPQSLAFFPSTGGRKLFSFFSLLLHFQSVHVEQRLNWKEDMIELPEPYRISGLRSLPGMDSQALAIIGEIFPDIMGQHPRELLKRKPEDLDALVYDRNNLDGLGSVLVDRSHGSFHGLIPRHPSKGMDPGYRSLQGGSRPFDVLHEEPRLDKEDQYDPTRPTFMSFSQPEAAKPSPGYRVQNVLAGSDSSPPGHAYSFESSPKRIKVESGEEHRVPDTQQRSPGFHVLHTAPDRYYRIASASRPIYMDSSGVVSQRAPDLEEEPEYVWIKRPRTGD